MNTRISVTNTTTISAPATRLAIAAGGAVLLLLASLHVLSPEYDPSWHVVSEYANGRYGWVLSLMFASWAVSSFALASVVWSQMRTSGGKIALGLLIAAGIGEAMASVFDINHPLHHLAGMIGVLSLPIAAMLISASGSHPSLVGCKERASLDSQPDLDQSCPDGLEFDRSVRFVYPLRRPYSRRWNSITSWYSIASWSHRAGWLCKQALVLAYCVWAMVVAGLALQLRPRPTGSVLLSGSRKKLRECREPRI